MLGNLQIALLRSSKEIGKLLKVEVRKETDGRRKVGWPRKRGTGYIRKEVGA